MHTARRFLWLFLAFSFAALALPVFAQRVIATLPVGQGPLSAAVNSVTNKIYVADWCGTDPSCTSGGAVTVIDGATGNTLSVHVGYYPYGVAVNDTDLIIDINGYFAAAGTGGLSLYGVQPCRVIDTRHVRNGLPFSGTLSPPVDVVDSPCSIPSAAQAYIFNASVVPSGALGYLTLWPDGTMRPLVSTLNALDGSISSNMAIVSTNNGSVDAYASGITQLILDISSYFAP